MSKVLSLDSTTESKADKISYSLIRYFTPMLILITISILTLTAIALLFIRIFLPDFRYSWLLATAGAFLAWISIFFWQLKMPFLLALPSWQPEYLFTDSPALLADQISWAYAFSVVTLGLGTLLTSTSHENRTTLAGTLILSIVGVLAVLAENPLTLVMAWTAIDLAELITLLQSVQEKRLRERVIIAFGTRVIGSFFLIWAGLTSVAEGSALNFASAPQKAGIFMLIAAGLRLGILPMHMPFRAESLLRRGYGTMLRLTAAASSLILLARIPYSSLQSPFIPYLLGLVALTALYSAWMWFRTTKALDARPFWLLGMASLALAATLHANPIGSVAWGLALVLGGGVLFLSAIQNKMLNRLLMLSVFAMSTLPMTLTATGWENKSTQWWGFWLILLPAHALLLAGYFRQVRRINTDNLKNHNKFTVLIYPLGISFMLFTLLLLGIWGWQGAASIGAWQLSLISILLITLFVWAYPRIRSLIPLQAHWLKPDTKKSKNFIYILSWNIYHFLRNLTFQLTNLLESDGGILWALLFIILFASLLAEGIR